MRSDIITGFDLGTESIKAVALERVRGEAMPRVLGSAAVPSQGVRKGTVINAEELALSLKGAVESLEMSLGLKIGEMFVGVGGSGLGFQKTKGLAAISRADSEVSREDAKRALSACEANLQRSRNREILHSFPLGYTIDNETATHDPVGLAGLKLEASSMYITLFTQQSRGVLKGFDEAELEVKDLYSGPMGLSCAALSRREKEAGVMLLDIGAATTSIILFEEGLPYSLEVLPYGSNNITHDIAVGLQVALPEAEKLKTSFGSVSSAADAAGGKKSDLVHGNYSKKKLSDIIEARLGDIFELVEKHLKKVERAGLLPAGVVMAGGGANLPGIADLARDHLKLPARIVELPDIGGYKDKVKEPEWYTALGVAMMACESDKSYSPFLVSAGFPFIFKWLKAFLP